MNMNSKSTSVTAKARPKDAKRKTLSPVTAANPAAAKDASSPSAAPKPPSKQSQVIALLERESCSPAVRLHAMATYDASQLAADRWNLGALYLLPEIRHLPTFAQFFALNERLRDRYRELCASARAAAGLPPDPARTKLPYRIVETATRMRVDGEEVDVELIADSVLAVLQLDRLNDADRAESAALARAVLDRVSRTT